MPEWRFGETRYKTNNKIRILSYINFLGSTLLIIVEPKTGISDTGDSKHYIKTSELYEKKNRKKHQPQWESQMEEKITPTKDCKLELTQLPEKSREGHILSGLTHGLLISIVKMCDAGCKSVFTYTNVHMIKYEKN